jgi:8-oxo-dGTP pyrophosphatase MutT (NUDIX family)
MWSAPGGKVEPDEAPIAAAIREIHEECGIAIGSPRRLAHTTYMTFAAPEGVQTWVALGYEFLLDQEVGLPEWTDPDAGVLGAEWLEIEEAADRVGKSAIPPVAKAFVDYCSSPDESVTRYYEFDVDLAREPQAELISYLTS